MRNINLKTKPNCSIFTKICCMRFNPLVTLVVLLGGFGYYLSLQGCAQISSPTGGAKDTLAPKLIRASPANASVNVKAGKITLQFNEFIQLQDAQKNLIVSPLQSKQPNVVEGLKTITIKLKDSLLPNTTYTINFGDAIKDLNEGNVYKDLTYVFSTGSYLDSLKITGKVFLAETGNVDSTLTMLLYRNAVDSTVTKIKPNYVAKVNGDGSFYFENLPAGNFRLYALKDGDGGKTYNSDKETFAFLDKEINTSKQQDTIEMFAFVAKKEKENSASKTYLQPKGRGKETPLKLALKSSPSHDILMPVELGSSTKLLKVDSTKIKLLDTNYAVQKAVKFSIDTTTNSMLVNTAWKKGFNYILVIPKDAITDTLQQNLAKADTIKFTTKADEDYGKLVLRFPNIDLAKKPVLQIFSGETRVVSTSLKIKEYSNNLFLPGTYNLKIVYDTDGDGDYTPGDYKLKRQPEKCVSISNTLSIKADWENEKDIEL
jgi:uncharacterized protein (DUF2141 family)